MDQSISKDASDVGPGGSTEVHQAQIHQDQGTVPNQSVDSGSSDQIGSSSQRTTEGDGGSGPAGLTTSASNPGATYVGGSAPAPAGIPTPVLGTYLGGPGSASAGSIPPHLGHPVQPPPGFAALQPGYLQYLAQVNGMYNPWMGMWGQGVPQVPPQTQAPSTSAAVPAVAPAPVPSSSTNPPLVQTSRDAPPPSRTNLSSLSQRADDREEEDNDDLDSVRSHSIMSSVSTKASAKTKATPQVELFVSANTDTVSQDKALMDTSSNTFSIVNSPEGTPMLIQASATASLYRPSSSGTRPPKPKADELGESELFRAFPEDAVIQGTHEDTPRLCMDPSQVVSLKDTLHTDCPVKLRPVPSFREAKYPLHESSETFLAPPMMDPIVASSKDSKKMGSEGGKVLVLPKHVEAADKRLRNVQLALKSGLAATLALQQGLGKLDAILGAILSTLRWPEPP